LASESRARELVLHGLAELDANSQQGESTPRWIITIPTWGQRCNDAFINVGLPSLRAALRLAKVPARFLIHTDDPIRIKKAMEGLDVFFRVVPAGRSPHHKLGTAHIDAINLAGDGQFICFLCADMVVSVECFAFAEKRFAQGKKIIMGASSRTFGDEPPIGAKSRDLLAWTMRHPHPITVDCFWETGKGDVPWAIYFKRGKNIVLRAFHLHPFAAVKDNKLKFSGATIDYDLAASYSHAEIHVVAGANEMAMAEVSPLSRILGGRSTPITVDSIAAWASRNTIDVHRWFFSDNPITITGTGQCGEIKIVEDVLRQLPSPRP
jgi:hypothetical protein